MVLTTMFLQGTSFSCIRELLRTIQVLRNAVGVEGVSHVPEKKALMNVISITIGWVGINFPERSVT